MQTTAKLEKNVGQRGFVFVFNIDKTQMCALGIVQEKKGIIARVMSLNM